MHKFENFKILKCNNVIMYKYKNLLIINNIAINKLNVSKFFKKNK